MLTTFRLYCPRQILKQTIPSNPRLINLSFKIDDSKAQDLNIWYLCLLYLPSLLFGKDSTKMTSVDCWKILKLNVFTLFNSCFSHNVRSNFYTITDQVIKMDVFAVVQLDVSINTFHKCFIIDQFLLLVINDYPYKFSQIKT